MVAKIKQEVFNDEFIGSNDDVVCVSYWGSVHNLLEQTENKGENALPLSPRRHLYEIGIV